MGVFGNNARDAWALLYGRMTRAERCEAAERERDEARAEVEGLQQKLGEQREPWIEEVKAQMLPAYRAKEAEVERLEKSVERLRTRRREAEERATKAEAEVERLREKARIEGEAGAGKSGRTTRPAGQPGCQSRPEPVPPHPSEEKGGQGG